MSITRVWPCTAVSILRNASAEAAHRVAGVHDVANDLESSPTASEAPSDLDIARVVRHALQWDALVPDERIDSTSNIILRLTFTEGEELVAQLDTIVLTPHSQMTRVYEVPGTQLSVYADSVGVAGSTGALDVLIYGQY